MLTDLQLLSRYADGGSEAAFGELVSRHVNLVYSTALRAVNRDAHLAFDVAQSVFTDLARKASALCRRRPKQTPGDGSEPSFLAGWLYTSSRFAASKAVRAEQTRRQHEQEAQAMRDVLQGECHEPNWAELRPVLEEAIDTLAEPERDAILLRFYEEKDIRTVGAMLGVSEEAARKRITRSLDKLRDLLARRGVTTTASALSVVLTAQAVEVAPAGLAATLTAGSLTAAAATTTAGSILGLLNLMASIKVKLGLAALCLAAVATPVYLQRQTNRELRANTAQLEQEVERLRLQAARPPAVEAPPVNRAEHSELLRLRGQVGRLRQELAVKEALSKPATAPPGLSQTQMANLAEPEEWRDGKFLPKEKLSNLGLATPEAAVQTYLWALVQEDAALVKSVLGDEAKVNIGIMREEFADRLGSATGVHFDGFSSNANTFTALISVQNSDDSELSKRVRLGLQEGSWRVLDDVWTPRKVLYGPTVTQQEESPQPGSTQPQ
jgi:RNA polymerase sigma factor (sigma-70 family)